MKKFSIILILIITITGIIIFKLKKPNPDTKTPANQTPTEQNLQSTIIVAENLNTPWELAFLPDGNILVTERPGNLKLIGKNGGTTKVTGVKHYGEGGLLGITLHPKFTDNHFIYLYLTTSKGSSTINRVNRYTLNNVELTNEQTIIDNIPGAIYHDGGRLAFGPDGHLYITTGDATKSSLSQDTQSLAGKILRLTDNGQIPTDNPFNNPVYSYGHRNVQGIAWDNRGQLWATEHGRSGVQSGMDEINLIEKGKNYGWPTIEGSESRSNLETPKANSGATTTWAPSGMTIIDNVLLFAGLKGESLYQTTIQNQTLSTILRNFTGQFGRLRTVTKGPDNRVYLLTSNTDGRGNPKPGDDKIISLDPNFINQK
jgi:glucose/arabinose dehydrogenase